MKIKNRDDVTNEGVRNLLNTDTNKTQKGTTEKERLIQQIGADGDVSVDVSLASAISSEFDPATFEKDRTERVAMIMKQVREGTYKAPSNDVLAMKLLDEVSYEIFEGRNLKERDE